MGELVREGSLGAVLCNARIITEEELSAALDEQQASGSRIGEALVALGVVAQEDIDWALSHQLDIPYVRLKPENIDPAALARVPAALARRYQLVPLFLAGEELSVAMADPLDQEALSALSQETGCRVNVTIALWREIREMLTHCYGEADLGFSSPLFSPAAVETLNADPSAAKLLNHLLLCAVKRQFSQLSLQTVGDQVLVVARQRGNSQEIGRLSAQGFPPLLARIRRLARLERPVPISATSVLWFLWQGKRIPFEVLMLREELVTLKPRLVAPLREISDLGLDQAREAELKELIQVPEGLVLVGCRESELVAGFMDLCLDAWEDRGKSALLLGEQLGRGRKGFPRVSVLRQGVDDTRQLLTAAVEHGPDLLAVEELGEPGAFLAATRAVLRGKRVLGGMASGSIQGVLERLMQLRREQYLMAGQLRGVLCLTHLLLLCPECKEEYQPAPGELAGLRLSVYPSRYFRPRGCPDCNHTGHMGRRYLLDLIRFDAPRWELLRGAHSAGELLGELRAAGYRGAAELGKELLERGEVSPAEYRLAIDN